jgi:hypothetical protein
MARPWIFGIGAGKTGSNSLAAALSQLGFVAKHVGDENYWGRSPYLQVLRDNIKNGRSVCDGIEDVDALIDWPIWSQFRSLDEQIEEAKFILTYRPPDDCALSWCRMIADQHTNIRPGWITSYTEYADEVRRHNDLVMRHFLGRPEKLLVLDIRDDDETKWKLLGKFLGVNAAGKGKYPKMFCHQEWETNDDN